MKVETTVTLSEELAAALGKRVEDPGALSQFVEDAIRAHLLRPRRKDASRDLAIINANFDALNAEAEDVLSYQDFPLSTLEPAGATPATETSADRVNSERLELLARKRGEGDLSLEEESRLEDLTRRVQRLLPRVTDQDWAHLEQMVTRAEDFQQRLRQIRQKHGLGDLA